MAKSKVLSLSEPWFPRLEHGPDTNLRLVRETEVT